MERGRRPSWRLRYGSVIGVSVAAMLGSWAMFAERPLFEPAVRILHAFLWHLRSSLGDYVPEDYVLYAGLLGVLGLVGLVLTVWSLATHRATDAKVDAFLEGRLPKHEVRLFKARKD